LRLLDQGVAEQLPGEVLGHTADFFQCLIDRDRADRHRRIAQDPFARFVDVPAGGKIHHGVGAPADRPCHLLDFLGDRTRHRRIADVGIDLHQEIAADDHRLAFRMVDVVRNDRPATRDFVAHEFRRDGLRNRRAEGLAAMLLQQRRIPQRFKLLVLPDRDEFHFRRDSAAPRIVHLGNIRDGLRTPRFRQTRKAHVVEFARSAGRPAARSTEYSGSVYGPEVSYRVKGALASAPKLDGVSASAISRIGTRRSSRLPRTYSLRDPAIGRVTSAVSAWAARSSSDTAAFMTRSVAWSSIDYRAHRPNAGTRSAISGE